MPVPKSWVIFFLIVVAIVVAILVTQPEGDVQTESVSGTTIDDTRGTTFSTMLEQGGNAIYVEDQLSEVSSVRVGFVVLAAPGFVVIFNNENGVPGTPIGNSQWLSTGGEHLIVPLAEPLIDGEVYYAMLFFDDGDRAFDSQKDTQARDSEESVVIMSFLSSKDAEPETEAVLP